MREQYKWKINERINILEEELLNIKNSELDIATILTIDLSVDYDELLVVVLLNMRAHRKLFQSELNKQKHDIKKELTDKLNELKQSIYYDEDKTD